MRSVYFAYLYIKNHEIHVTLTLIPNEPVTLEQAVSKLTSCTLSGIGLMSVSIKDYTGVFTVASPLMTAVWWQLSKNTGHGGIKSLPKPFIRGPASPQPHDTSV